MALGALLWPVLGFARPVRSIHAWAGWGRCRAITGVVHRQQKTRHNGGRCRLLHIAKCGKDESRQQQDEKNCVHARYPH